MELPNEFLEGLNKMLNKKAHGFCVIFPNGGVAKKWEAKLRRFIKQDEGLDSGWITVKRPDEMLDTVVVCNAMYFGRKFNSNDYLIIKEVFTHCYCVYDDQLPMFLKFKAGKCAKYEELLELKEKRRCEVLNIAPPGMLDTSTCNVVE